jgi:hypothetical protein
MKTLQETRDKLGAFLGALKDTGHQAENVRKVLRELLGEPRQTADCGLCGSQILVGAFPARDVPSDANQGEKQ